MPLSDADFANIPSSGGMSRPTTLTDADFTQPPSAMDPHPLKSGLRRVGKAIADIDPSNPANVPTTAKFAVGTAIPLAAGAAAGFALGPEASPEAAAITRTAAQGLAGALVPYAEYATGKVMGEKLVPPTVRDAFHSAAFNAGVAGLGEVIGGASGTAAAVKPEMERAPKTVAQFNQAVRDRGFWEKVGLNKDQIDSVLAMPTDEQAMVARQIQAGSEYKQAFTNVMQDVRGNFNKRYEAVGGEHWDAPVPGKPIADIFGNAPQLAKGQPLSPGFGKWLEQKAREVQQGLPREYIDSDDPDLQARLKLFGRSGKDQVTPRELQQMRTELDRHVPRNASNTDKQVAAQVREQLTTQLTDGLKAAGATPEQVGALGGIDQDYARFQDIRRTFDPRDEKYGQNVANALFDPMVTNSGAAGELIGMAKTADKAFPGTMDKLREALSMKTLQESSKGATPLDQMEILRTMQNKWGDSGSRAVLAGLYGPKSPMADPVTFSKVLATPVDMRDMSRIAQWGQRSANAPYILRAMALAGVAGGSIYSAYQHPERIPEILGALAGLAVGSKLLGKLDLAGQKAYVNFKLNPTPESFQTFMRTSGAMIGAGTSMPAKAE